MKYLQSHTCSTVLHWFFFLLSNMLMVITFVNNSGHLCWRNLSDINVNIIGIRVLHGSFDQNSEAVWEDFFVTLYLCLFSAFWFNRQLFETGLYLQKGNLYFPVYICTKFSVVLQFLINARKIFFMSKLISFSIEIDQSKNSFKLTYV